MAGAQRLEGGRGLPGRAADAAAAAVVRAAWKGLAGLPLATARGLLGGLARAWARLDARHARVVRANLDLAFPGMDAVVRGEVEAAAFTNWARLLAEVAHADELVERGRERGEWRAVAAAVVEAGREGRGVLLLTAHTGNFEMLARLFGMLVAPVAVFHRPLGLEAADSLLLADRARHRVVSLGRGAAVREALRILAGGGCVAVPLDQNQRPGHGVFVDVLGHPACTSTMLARLALASGASVLPLFGVWAGVDTLPVLGEAIAAPDRSPRRGPTAAPSREEVLLAATREYAAQVDRVVRRFPHQWNWAHRRWKTRPEDAAG